MTASPCTYSNEYIERTVRHYDRMADEIYQLRIANTIYKAQVERLEQKLTSLGVNPTSWTSLPFDKLNRSTAQKKLYLAIIPQEKTYEY